ncbi:SH3 domain-containing protein [Pseudohalocynthiibacter aestuariivivens]|uniref:SH3 domain-containing protein n=1 Tax=Roseovarius pelagicus TaxID=2980108 RepID=A0ABY6DL09_9RHOB|nr:MULTISPECIES: SH3 domain-containing protein [Rhodobacterales]QIE46995.1 SH3 domain-containing protein [Pseudohalocynthiibacter aestuariivivens]UXX84455.1 SH3 domain-containing protein [Roseovarius pelagicus]
MWRFILLTFAFLGFAFYHLSGGADYAPRADSLQVAFQNKSFFAQPKPAQPRARQVASADTKTKLTPRLIQQKREAVQAAHDAREARKEARYLQAQEATRFKVTLAAASPAKSVFNPEPIKEMGLSGVGAFSGGTLARDVTGVIGGQNGMQTGADVTPEPADIRAVTGTLVNMRNGPGTDFAQVDQLSQGMQVEVLETAANGWVHLRALDTGQTGWMADWLVTAAAQ